MHYVTAFPSIMNAYLLPISNVAKTPQEMENEKLREKLKKLKLSSPIKEIHAKNTDYYRALVKTLDMEEIE